MRESTIEKKFCEAAEIRGWLVRKFVSPGHRGVPDRIVLLPMGIAVFVEFKAPGETPTPIQFREHQRFLGLGFHVWVIDSESDIDNFMTHYT